MLRSPFENPTRTAGRRPATLRGFLLAAGLDARLASLLVVLALMWLGFDLAAWSVTGRAQFLTSRNLWNLLVQASSICIMTSAMALVIMIRQVDLAAGSTLGFVAILVGCLQTGALSLWFPAGSPVIWILGALAGVLAGCLIGALHGTLVAYAGIPSFVVTLAGLVFWRGAAFVLADGQTIAPLAPGYSLLGGGQQGSIGETSSSLLGALACTAILWGMRRSHVHRKFHQLDQRPWWAEAFRCVLPCALVIGLVALVNSYVLPAGAARRTLLVPGLAELSRFPPIGHGFAIPMLLALGVAAAMIFVSTRTAFGRHVRAMGGNPEAAELAGIDTRRVTVTVFALMGVMAALSAIITTARLDSAGVAFGQSDEVYVIAATVIGGPAMSGGTGTVAGALLGALIMQSLQGGMTLLGFDTDVLQMTLAVLLCVAVGIGAARQVRAAG